jgi:hypothetical protein
MFINYVATSFPNDDDDLSNRKPSLLVYKEVNFRSSHSFNKKRLFQERGSFEMTAALNTHKLHQDLSPSLYKAKGKMITRTRKLSSPPFTKELPKRRPNSRPNRRPKRPLSAYNIFFRLCRRQLIQDPSTSGWRFPETKKELRDEIARVLQADSAAVPKKRKHRRTHGKVGFKEMVHIIGERWRNIDRDSKGVLVAAASIEKERYAKKRRDWEDDLASGCTANANTAAHEQSPKQLPSTSNPPQTPKVQNPSAQANALDFFALLERNRVRLRLLSDQQEKRPGVARMDMAAFLWELNSMSPALPQNAIRAATDLNDHFSFEPDPISPTLPPDSPCHAENSMDTDVIHLIQGLLDLDKDANDGDVFRPVRAISA